MQTITEETKKKAVKLKVFQITEPTLRFVLQVGPFPPVKVPLHFTLTFLRTLGQIRHKTNNLF